MDIAIRSYIASKLSKRENESTIVIDDGYISHAYIDELNLESVGKLRATMKNLKNIKKTLNASYVFISFGWKVWNEEEYRVEDGTFLINDIINYKVGSK